MTSVIKQLDAVTINKIAAGEVIDRPVSIVKELCENAIDAGATQITIDIEDGGKQRIRITDNGYGFYKEDLPLAPLKHSTSKIQALEDIYQTETFGFRGEALSSICHCAHLSITSKQEHAPAYSITAHEDYISEVKPASHSKGTTIDVQGLFENLPVRQRFLKTQATEFSYIYETCVHLSLIHPSIDFKLISNGIEKLNTTGINSLFEVIFLLYGREAHEACVPLDESIGPNSFSGYISNPTYTLSNKTKQVFSVNGRLIKNPLLSKALQQSYKDIIPARRFPLAVLNISTSSSSLDVNIHPQKLDVKFLNPGFIFDCLPKVIYQSLQASQSHTRPLDSIMQPPIKSSASITQTPQFTPSYAYTPTPLSSSSKHPPTQSTQAVNDLSRPLSENIPTPPTPNKIGYEPLEFLQILNTYIILKTDTGAYMIDQHAVHERILYERIKQESSSQKARQVLLLSEIIPLSADLMAIFMSQQDFFKSLNFIIEPFGTTDIAIREIPVMFQLASIPSLIIDMLEQLKTYPQSSRDLTLDQKEKLQRQACRAAIKAGQCLQESEIRKLLEDFMSSPQNYTCPHGRPLFKFFNQTKFESLFLRN